MNSLYNNSKFQPNTPIEVSCNRKFRVDRGWVTKFTNVRILRGHKIIREDIWVKDGVIIDPRPRFWEAAKIHEFSADEVIDCQGMIAAPGLIDLQINGAFGVDFTIASESQVDFVAESILQHGVTAFCATIVTSAPETYRTVLSKLKKKDGSVKGAEMLGIHLEGPFLSEHKFGAHNPELVRSTVGGKKAIQEMYGDDLSNVVIVTMAPELDGSEEMIRELTDMGIVVSAGHSAASFAEAEKSIDWGVKMVTHMFNAMNPFHHRDPGLVGLLGSGKKPYYSVIADGVHAHHASLRIAATANPDGVILITDAITPMGLGTGEFPLGTQTVSTVQEDDGFFRAKVKGTGILAGSVATMIECVQKFRKATNCPVEVALEAASLHPAQVLNIQSKKGTLDFGADADIILVDDELNLHATYVRGQLAFPKKKKHDTATIQ